MKYLVGLLVTAVIAGALATPVMAKDYTIILLEPDASEMMVLEMDSVAPVRDDLRTVWTITFSRGDKAKKSGAARIRSMYWFDCARSRLALGAIQAFEVGKTKPFAEKMQSEDKLQWLDEGPDTAFTYMHGHVCGTKPLNPSLLRQAEDDLALEQYFLTQLRYKPSGN
ncbi:hypothetical protein ABAC460_20805 [Asticcacaulis sp. AC460]|uniref:hypothetical protein n=1 Tax=Asticcacaulis sp. AC460 TaxID=1282360 RepID=UPI0003C410F7|nr:hypothetical protein [Asticcacaulis sp. AC460]ESQ87214.1 hypothetical protein ABAC460_20805 [Asticcacaulis sp. AC460]